MELDRNLVTGSMAMLVLKLLEDGDLYLYFVEETAYGPVLTGLTGPYPGGEVNH